jgi:hypothetical protein
MVKVDKEIVVDMSKFQKIGLSVKNMMGDFS